MKVPRDLFTRHPFWEGLPEDDVVSLVDSATLEHFRAHEPIFWNACVAEHFYLIVEGLVALESPYSPGQPAATVQTIGEGDVLGWSWLFPPYRWHFTAIALTPTSAIVLPAETLRRKAADEPAFGYRLALRIGDMLLQRLQATRMRLLSLAEVPQ